MKPGFSPVRILLIEDNPGDVELTRQGLVDGKISNELDVAPTAEAALALLREPGREPPDLILLDLNLPGMDGRELLAILKADPALTPIPVVVLTTSEAERDIVRAYETHANAYMSKPVDFDQFVELVRGLANYWFSLVRLPPR